MNTKDLIDRALASEKQRAPYNRESQWLHFAQDPASLVEVEVALVRPHYNALRTEITGWEKRTTFFWGTERISRKKAEQILAWTIR